ncbi:hypothetical protein PMNALOAF_1261 [Methylobacterium adhaesivum]|uniref:Tail assembly chaperone n=1 Tax=Methylobacterium adhaesivum TaxID=333297 RepID=A0ABT8BF06_9HYPH|nr:hypothetical protein [Methylobacterium adhaesivum]MDN3590596.1 hypothetical protein [Methylobacterium adhaesivum]GJD30018.1 hypothetical protein PMNALOAF_1261 [Methylobacterium adhaesivum]
MTQINKVFVSAEDTVLAVHPYDQAVADDAYGAGVTVAFFDATEMPSPVEDTFDEEGRRMGGVPRRLDKGWAKKHVPPLPDSVTSTQGKLALIAAGLYEGVLGAIQDVPDPTERLIAQTKFDAARWYRTDPLFSEIAGAIGIPAKQFDGLWRDAMAR